MEVFILFLIITFGDEGCETEACVQRLHHELVVNSDGVKLYPDLASCLEDYDVIRKQREDVGGGICINRQEYEKMRERKERVFTG